MIIQKEATYTPTGAKRGLHIYLPDNYDQTDKRYPVLYFFDGHNLFFDEYATYGRSWRMQSFLWNWDKEIIIVGIECGHEGNERLSEYQPYQHRTGEFAKIKGMGDATMQWIVNELKPEIDRELRTLPDRENTAIAGSSMGGLMALYAVMKYNTTFSKAACISPAVSSSLTAVRKDADACELGENTRVYISWGTKEAAGIKDETKEDKSSTTYRNNKSVAGKLEKKGAAVKLFSQVGGEHNEASWGEQESEFMNFLWA